MPLARVRRARSNVAKSRPYVRLGTELLVRCLYACAIQTDAERNSKFRGRGAKSQLM
jgi:hypothetical protein